MVDTYFETHEELPEIKRKKRKRVGQYDPNASKADKRYKEHYGL